MNEPIQRFRSNCERVVGCDGEVVRRRTSFWTPAVHGLLSHLEAVGFPYSPRVLGVDDDGCELLTYIPGVSGRDSWRKVVPENGLAAVARLLREYHDAVTDYRPTTSEWATVSKPIQEDEVVCHGDFGPWNIVWQGPDQAGIVDWDLAGPRPPVYDVAYALEYVAPFRDDHECVRWLAYPEPPNRARRIRIFADAYGLSSVTGLVDEVLAVQRDTIRAVRDLADRGLQPQVEWVAEGHLDELARRVQWTEANRNLFEGG